jgi:hypothetical protein
VDRQQLRSVYLLTYPRPDSGLCFVFRAAVLPNDDEQVIAPFLIVLRVANRTALTGEAIASGNIGSIHFMSQEKSTDGGASFPDGDPVSSVNTSGEDPGELGVVVIEEVPL